MKRQILGIILGIVLVFCSIMGLYLTEKDIDLYKPPMVELQDNLDSIEGIGDTLKVRVGSELYIWIDEINRVNQDRMELVGKYSLFMLIFSVIGLLFIILNFLVILLKLNECHLMREHRATQKIVLEEKEL